MFILKYIVVWIIKFSLVCYKRISNQILRQDVCSILA